MTSGGNSYNIYPQKVGDKTQGVTSTLKSRGTCPPVHTRFYAHDSFIHHHHHHQSAYT